MWPGCLGLQHPHAPQQPPDDTLCPMIPSHQVPVASTFPSSHAVAPCVSLWYLCTHKAIHKLVQAGLATTEVAQVNIL